MPRKGQTARFVWNHGFVSVLLLGAIAANAQERPDAAKTSAIETAHGKLAQGDPPKAISPTPQPQGVLKAGASGKPPAAPAGKLKRIRYVAPEYPSDALHAGISGYVVVDFAVNTNGEPIDLQVVDAKPLGVFDTAAIEAVKRWRYEPTDSPVPTRTTLRFELPQSGLK